MDEERWKFEKCHQIISQSLKHAIAIKGAAFPLVGNS